MWEQWRTVLAVFVGTALLERPECQSPGLSTVRGLALYLWSHGCDSPGTVGEQPSSPLLSTRK